jgi:hypothetical protein
MGLGPGRIPRLGESEQRSRVMRGVFLSGLVVLVMAAGSCGKSEQPSAGEAASAAPAPTPDPHPPIAILNTPGEGAKVPNKSWGTGWALDDSGILSVTATTDGVAVVPARIGDPFPGVKEAHPEMPNNDRAGFIFGLPDLPPGPHTVSVEVVAKDGGRLVLTQHFIVR